MFLLLLAVTLIVVVIAWGRARADHRAPISNAEWLAGSEIGLLLVAVAVSGIAEELGFACVLLALGGSALVLIFSVAELIRIAWSKSTNLRRRPTDALLCVLAMGIATLVIFEATARPLWV